MPRRPHRSSGTGRWLRLVAAVAVAAMVLGCDVPPSSPANRPAGSPASEALSPEGPGGGPPTHPGATSTGDPTIRVRVERNRLVDGDGRPLRLRGFNHAGAEYACIEGYGFFDTPGGQPPDESAVAAMRAWHGANAVRVPLNEQCWLGLPAAPAAYAGEGYRAAVRAFVARLNRHGFVAILDLHRSAPGVAASRKQEQMPDRDHSVAFWTSVASTLRSESVVFDLFNEPFPDAEPNSERAWGCWRDGGCTLLSTNSGRRYVAAGMNELIAAIRATGSRTVVLAGGIYWAESLTGWLRHRPADPLGQLGASFHAYSFNRYCARVACYDRDLAPIAAAVPLVVGEIGPALAITGHPDEGCPRTAVRAGGFAASTLDWLDTHGASWTAWTWNPWRDCWSLVRDWTGAPTAPWGAEVRRRLAAG